VSGHYHYIDLPVGVAAAASSGSLDPVLTSDTWCADQDPALEPLPAAPSTVALYITAQVETRKPSTIRRRLASISVAHQVAGFETPTADAGVRAVWAGIRRAQGMAPRKMRAARTKVITAMVAPLGDGLPDVRDRTLLLFGFAGALRRSELVALDVEDVSEDDGGLRLILRRSKTDQDAEGAIRGLPYGSHPASCPAPGRCSISCWSVSARCTCCGAVARGQLTRTRQAAAALHAPGTPRTFISVGVPVRGRGKRFGGGNRARQSPISASSRAVRSTWARGRLRKMCASVLWWAL
jgi:hypothetical protein